MANNLSTISTFGWEDFSPSSVDIFYPQIPYFIPKYKVIHLFTPPVDNFDGKPRVYLALPKEEKIMYNKCDMKQYAISVAGFQASCAGLSPRRGVFSLHTKEPHSHSGLNLHKEALLCPQLLFLLLLLICLIRFLIMQNCI